MKRIAAVFLLLLSVVAISAQSGRITRPRIVTQTPSQTDQTKEKQTNSQQTQNQGHSDSNNQTEVQPKSASGNEKVVGDDDEVLKIETNLVTIPVSVFDRNGRYLPSLRQTDFKVFEDGKEQEVAYFGTSEQPVSVVLVLDTSPSTEYAIEQIQEAAISFVNQLKQNDKVMVIEFDSSINVLSDFTNDRYRLARAIRKADFGDGTSLYDTVENVIEKRLKKVEGRKAVVMFTDGVDTTSYKADYYSSLQVAEESEAPFYVVYYNTYARNGNSGGGVMTSPYPPIWKNPFPFPFPSGGGGSQRNPRGTSSRDYAEGRRYLESLTDKSGGRMFNTETERSLEDTFMGVAEELRRQYVIGYYPNDSGQVGQRKQLKVRVNRPNVVVKARESYVVGSDTSQPNSTATAPPKQGN